MTKATRKNRTGAKTLGSYERRLHWKYNSLLGRVAMGKSGVTAVQDHPLVSTEAKALARDIEMQLLQLDNLLRTTKLKV